MELFLKETEADLAFLARTGCYNCRSCRNRKLERFNVIFIGTGSWKPLSPVFFVPICFAIIVDVEIEWKCFANIEAFVLKNGIYFFSSRFLLSMWNEAFEVPLIMEHYLGIWFVFGKLLAPWEIQISASENWLVRSPEQNGQWDRVTSGPSQCIFPILE